MFHILLSSLIIKIFFEGVEARVAAGVKIEEVGFQLAFSKQELRKVIKEYPGKEVSTVVVTLVLYSSALLYIIICSDSLSP